MICKCIPLWKNWVALELKYIRLTNLDNDGRKGDNSTNDIRQFFITL